MAKNLRLRFEPHPKKEPRFASDPQSYYAQRPSWRLACIELVDPFGWHTIDKDKIYEIRRKLADFETRTWNEILLLSQKQNHKVSIDRICKDARARLVERKQQDIDELVSLRLSGAERVWGILREGALELLWWDPDHQVCPSLKKHT